MNTVTMAEQMRQKVLVAGMDRFEHISNISRSVSNSDLSGTVRQKVTYFLLALLTTCSCNYGNNRVGKVYYKYS